MLPYSTTSGSRIYQPTSYLQNQPQNSSINAQKQKQDALHQMRKHKSLDGHQFLQQFEQATRHHATHYPEYYQYDNYDYQRPSFYSPQSIPPPPPSMAYDPVNIPTSNHDNYYQTNSLNQQNYDGLQREINDLNQRLNYVMNSIRTFWSPELKKERELRKEEAIRLNSFQNKICQQAVSLFYMFQ